MNRPLLFTVSSVLLINIMMLAAPAHPVEAADELDSESYADFLSFNDNMTEADSLAMAYTDSLLTRANELFKEVNFIKLDKEAADTLYSRVDEAYKTSMKVLPMLVPKSSSWNSIVNTLINLDAFLERGAYHFSSLGDQANLNKFARAYLDIQLMDETKDVQFKRDPAPFSQMAYIAASDAYNKAEYDKAIEYFRLYFSTGMPEHRERVYVFMGQACYLNKNYDLAITTMAEGMKQYPNNQNIPLIGVQCCIDGGQPEYLHDFLDKAVEQNPNDINLLEAQGKLYEDEYEFKKALDVFQRIEELDPKKLSTAKHIAVCYYNTGVDYFNKAVNESNEKIAVKHRRQAKNYFTAAKDQLEEIIVADPLSERYLTMLGRCYLGLEEKEKFEEINRKLAALGSNPLTEMFNIPTMGFSEDGGLNYKGRVGGKRLYDDEGVPLYSEFGTNYIKEALEKWVKKGEFETIADYNARVNDVTIENEFKRLSLEAQQEYLDKYSGNLHLSDIKLQPYDSSNETFLIETNYGPITLKVPNTDKEAEAFKNNWEGMRFSNPKFIISDNKVTISSVTVKAPYGKSYSYDSGLELAYSQTLISVDLEAILKGVAKNNDTAMSSSKTDKLVVTKKSDVDVDIPVSNKPQKNTFALIIANENYSNGVSRVQSALHDGEVFAEYCNKTLGIPESNISLYKDATYGTMIGAILQLKNLVNSWGNDAEVIFYYAGHGMPDEKTHDAFILPTDAIPSMTNTGISLDKLYSELENIKSQSVAVFLDACFSGATRDGGMVYDARGVVLDPKESAPRGNMFILSAASGKETAMQYAEKNHGLFTYFLLKKLKDSKGNVTLKELSDYVIENVSRSSNMVNKKPQTPTVTTSGNMTNQFKSKKLR